MPQISPPHSHLDPQVLARVHGASVRARLVVEGFVSGMHRSPFQGYSVEFAQHREYAPGDEIKHIDWKVWARNDRLFIKQYEEETNLRCTLVLDSSNSMGYQGVSGTKEAPRLSKYDYGATLAATLAFLLQRQMDASGLILFDEDIQLNLPASAHPRHLRELLHHLDETTPSRITDAGSVFPRLTEAIQRRGLVVIISDLFMEYESLEKVLRQLRQRRQEVLLFQILDADEVEFPFADNTLFQGLEDASELMADPRALRKSYLQALNTYIRRVRRLCGNTGTDYVLCNTSENLAAPLTRYLAARQRAGMVLQGGRA